MSYLVLFCSCVSSVLLALRLPRLGKRELILVPFVRCSICAFLVLSVSSSSWCLGRAAACDYGTPWTFLLPFFVLNLRNYKFHSKYVIKQPPFTDGEQQTYRTGGEADKPEGREAADTGETPDGRGATDTTIGREAADTLASVICFPPCQIQWCQLEWSVANGVAHPFRLF